MTIGKRLKELRKSKGLTQKEIAQQLDLPYQNLSNYERDFRQPDYATLIKLADFFEKSLDFLIRRVQLPAQNKSGEDFFEYLTELYTEHEIGDRGLANIKEWEKLSKEDLNDLAIFFEWLVYRREKQ